MGGCGGKKRRDRLKEARKGMATIGGKFDSIGNLQDQRANLELMTRLMGEIGTTRTGPISTPELTSDDRLFMADCLIKMNQFGSGAMFGWRQVAKMVEIHRKVVDGREERERERAQKNADTGGKGKIGSINEAREPEGGDEKVDTPSPGGVRRGGGGDGSN